MSMLSGRKPAGFPALDPLARNTWLWPATAGYADRACVRARRARSRLPRVIAAAATLSRSRPPPFAAAPRRYQLEMASGALFTNTLVSLPTGLGKTFIAAVCMWNYWRWFPGGKVVFLAPTKPLVTQQISACFKIVGIPERDTARMFGASGGKNKLAERAAFWRDKSVFFATPQTFHNDIKAGRCEPRAVTLLVVDEAHKAVGESSYVQCVRALDAAGARYRVLALSATPGKDLNAVADVVRNLHIARIDARTSDDASVKPYRKDVTVDRVTVPLPMLIGPPIEGAPGAIRVEVRGTRGGERHDVVYGAFDRPSVATAAVAAVVAVALASGGSEFDPGAGGLARVREARPLLRELARRGVRAAVFEGSRDFGVAEDLDGQIG
jgi:hypothetical protein